MRPPHDPRLTSQLEHPGIVPVYELGQRRDGRPYYTMKFVHGKTLEQSINESQTLQERLGLLTHFVGVCQALAYAHSRGVIHRDLKPGNIMIGEFGETIVLDWGLAKFRQAKDEKEEELARTLEALCEGNEHELALTQYGAALGTPSYMPPEQARGELEKVNERSDVYSLGAVLYTILTQRPPFAGPLHEIVRQVQHDAPPPVERLVPATPPELIAICNRAMSKAPEARYQSAKDLADEVHRFLSGALVQAHQYRFKDYLLRFIKHHKKILTVAAAALFWLHVIAGVAAWRVIAARDTALHESERARAAEEVAVAEKKRADNELYLSNIGLVQRNMELKQFDAARELLNSIDPDHRRWEWGRLQFVANQDVETFKPEEGANTGFDRAIVLNLRHNLLVSRNTAHELTLRRLFPIVETGGFSGAVGQVPLSCRISADGAHMLVTDENYVRIFTAPFDKSDFKKKYFHHYFPLMDFSADGSAFIYRSAEDVISVCSVSSGKTLAKLPSLSVAHAIMSPDARLIATIATPGLRQPESSRQLLVFDGTSGKTAAYLPFFPSALPVFSNDGETLLLSNGPAQVSAYDAATWSLGWSMSTSGEVLSLAMSPADALAAAGDSEGVLHVRDLDSAKITEMKIGSPVTTIAFSQDATLVAAAAEDLSIHVFETATGNPLQVFTGHSTPIVELQFDPVNEILASITAVEMKLWNLNALGSVSRIDQLRAVDTVIRDRTATLVLAGGEVMRFDLDSLRHEQVNEVGPGIDYLLAPGGNKILIRDDDTANLIDISSGEVLELAQGEISCTTRAAFSGDGALVAFIEREANRTFTVVHETQHGKRLHKLLLFERSGKHAFDSIAVSFSPSNARLTVGVEDTFTYWTIATGALEANFAIPPMADRVQNFMVYDAKGARVAYEGEGHSIVVINPRDGVLLSQFRGHSSELRGLAFSPDGDRIVSADAAGICKVWEAATGRELLRLPEVEKGINELLFAAPGELVVAGNRAPLQILRAFDVEDDAFPGSTHLDFKQRLAAYRQLHPALVTSWGRCQQEMARIVQAKRQHVLAHNLPLEAPLDITSFISQSGCPGNGTYALASAATLPSCSIHGQISAQAFVLQAVDWIDRLAPDQEREFALASAGLQQFFAVMAPNNAQAFIDPLVTPESHHLRVARAVLEGMAAGSTGADWARPKLGMTCLWLKDYESAVKYLSYHLEQDPRKLPDSTNLFYAAALARRGKDGDIDKAHEQLIAYLEFSPSSNAEEFQTALAALEEAAPPANTILAKNLSTLLNEQNDFSGQIEWYNNFENAVQAAKRQDKLLFLEFTTDASLAGEQLEKEFYSRPRNVELLNQYYVPCKLDLFKHEREAAALGVEQVPALFALDANGNIFEELSGRQASKLASSAFLFPMGQRGYFQTWRVSNIFHAAKDEEPLAKHLLNPEEHSNLTWTTVKANAVSALVRPLGDPVDFLDNSYYAYCRFIASEDAEVTIQPEGAIHAAFINGEKAGGDFHNGKIIKGENILVIRHNDYAAFQSRLMDEHGNPVKLEPLPLPEKPLSSISSLGKFRYLDAEAAAVPVNPDKGRIQVDVAEFHKVFRANMLSYIAQLQPKVVVEDGKVIGITTENPVSTFPLAQKYGLKDGDIVTSLNGVKAAEFFTPDKRLLPDNGRLKEILQGKKAYVATLLRDGKEIELHYDLIRERPPEVDSQD